MMEEKPKQPAEQIKQLADKTSDPKLKQAIEDKAKQVQQPVTK